MRKIEHIEEQIRELSEAELAQFRQWFADFDARAWDKQFESDARAGKPDRLGEEARRAHTQGKTTKL